MLEIEFVINRFGGLTALARALGHKHPSTVQGWKQSGKIPSWREHEIKKAAEQLNISLETANVS